MQMDAVVCTIVQFLACCNHNIHTPFSINQNNQFPSIFSFFCSISTKSRFYFMRYWNTRVSEMFFKNIFIEGKINSGLKIKSPLLLEHTTPLLCFIRWKISQLQRWQFYNQIFLSLHVPLLFSTSNFRKHHHICMCAILSLRLAFNPLRFMVFIASSNKIDLCVHTA